ncbi:hypothetical protein RvY_02316-2 [Ramazzottius varieornatus]|uniref:Chitin-binding type-2 domain-containing protein n=1 Tax=Ramazzottius varieornatus TaxID=947166 RepID=A0A1D1UK29_RAMVA|nr:hypothetical protein RvY_02316-2 [Ramazzottius varieornatus]
MQKRLSVLNIMYRKGSMDNSTRRYQSYYTPAQPTTIAAIEGKGPKFSQNDLADAIASLRTTRVRFSVSSRSPSVDSTDTTTTTTTSTSTTPVSTSTSSSTQPPPLRDRPPFEVRRVSLDIPPSQQLPYAPPVASKRTPSVRLPPPTHPYIHPVDRIKEYPATRQPPIIYTFDRPETLNPSYHELMPPTPPRKPSSPVPTTVSHTPPYVTVHNTPTVPPRVHWTPSPPRGSQTPSPTFQARLNINPERKTKKTTTAPLRRTSSTTTPLPWMSSKNITTTTPFGSGAPMAASCRGRIGYFSDMSPECNAFLYCDQFGRSFRFLCPDGSQFNPRMCLCDMHSVQCSVTGPVVSFDDPCPPLI